MNEEMRCAECKCANGGVECTWIAPPRADDRLYTQADLDAAVAAEREACAQVADALGDIWWSEYKDRCSPFSGMTHHEGKSDGAFAAATAIRARGDTPIPSPGG